MRTESIKVNTMSQKPKTSLDKLAEKLGIVNDRPYRKGIVNDRSYKVPTAPISEKIEPQKYNNVTRQNVQGQQCFQCFECTIIINGPDSAYYEAWEKLVPQVDSDQRMFPILRKLCRSCGVKHQTRL